MSIFLAVMVFYIEFHIASQMDNFQEPTYTLPLYNIEMKGTKAVVAHIGNIAFGTIALIIACFCYKEFRK